MFCILFSIGTHVFEELHEKTAFSRLLLTYMQYAALQWISLQPDAEQHFMKPKLNVSESGGLGSKSNVSYSDQFKKKKLKKKCKKMNQSH